MPPNEINIIPRGIMLPPNGIKLILWGIMLPPKEKLSFPSGKYFVLYTKDALSQVFTFSLPVFSFGGIC